MQCNAMPCHAGREGKGGKGPYISGSRDTVHYNIPDHACANKTSTQHRIASRGCLTAESGRVAPTQYREEEEDGKGDRDHKGNARGDEEVDHASHEPSPRVGGLINPAQRAHGGEAGRGARGTFRPQDSRSSATLLQRDVRVLRTEGTEDRQSHSGRGRRGQAQAY